MSDAGVRLAPSGSVEARFGPYGGRYVPEVLLAALDELTAAWEEARSDSAYLDELEALLRDFVGRPTPLYLAGRLSERVGRIIYLKREDLAHTGAHKINNAVGQALLARRMGKSRIIAETGAGQHGVATATACALLGLECIVYMGTEDMRRQRPNVERMGLMGATVEPVDAGARTLKEAVSAAIRDWVANVADTHYIIGSAVGPGDLVARSGGDEFVVMSVGLERNLDVVGLAGRLHESFDDPFALGEDEFTATISIGVAIASDGAPSAEALVGDAEAALERNPAGARRLELFDPDLRARLRDRSELATDLGMALRHDRLTLAYQPIVDVASGRVAAVEALARWKHPERGPISPELFVAIAEESGLSDELLLRVLEHAGSGFAAIAAADPEGRIALAFNVTARQLASDALIPAVRTLLARCGVSPERIVVEISEKALGGEADRFLPRIVELRELGLKISLDDFGTASTSISQLRGLPVDEIKLDRSFVSGLGAESADAALAAGLLPIARALGIQVVAEGIETDQQLAHLFALGYRWGQGYRFSAPQPPNEIASLLARGPLPPASVTGFSRVDAEHQRFREALLAGDAKGAESVIAKAVRSGLGAMTIQTEIIGRALRWVDSEWEAGRLDAADEHLAAAICERQLTTVLDTLRPHKGRFSRRVLLAAIRGEGHAADLRQAADALGSEGYETVFLGTDVEGDTLETATGTHQPGAVHLTLSTPDADAELDDVIDRLKAVEKPPLLLIGGDALNEGGAGHEGAIQVTSTTDALDVLARELAP